MKLRCLHFCVRCNLFRLGISYNILAAEFIFFGSHQDKTIIVIKFTYEGNLVTFY